MSRGRASTNQTFFAGESQTQLDDIADEQTIICRQLFAGHVVGFQPMKRKKNLHRMIISFIVLQFSHIILYYSLLNSPRWFNTVTGDETGLTSQLGSIVRTLFTYNTNRNRTVNYPFCSPQQSLNNLQYQKTIKYGTRKSTLCTSWLFFASKYGIFLEGKCCIKWESEHSEVCGKRVNRGAGL